MVVFQPISAKKKIFLRNKKSNGLSSTEPRSELRAEIFVFFRWGRRVIARLAGEKTGQPVRAPVCEAFTGVCDQNGCELESYYCSKNTLYQG